MLELSFSRESRLRKSSEFRRVYEEGTRFNGHYMTVFILPAEGDIHRMGVTASKKGIGKSYQRNRAKRLLRETFRLSREQLADLSTRYDWVFNARRSLLEAKLEASYGDFQKIIDSVREFEIRRGEENAVSGNREP